MTTEENNFAPMLCAGHRAHVAAIWCFYSGWTLKSAVMPDITSFSQPVEKHKILYLE